METDSWECGGMNWTDKFAEEFKQYRGYDLLDVYKRQDMGWRYWPCEGSTCMDGQTK